MPTFKATVDGKVRLVKADTKAKAKAHLVPEIELEAVKADELVDLMDQGIKVEKAGVTPPSAEIKAGTNKPAE